MKRLLPAFLLLSGCGALANRPPDPDPRHLQIAWRADFATATREAVATGRPILVCLISGDKLDRC